MAEEALAFSGVVISGNEERIPPSCFFEPPCGVQWAQLGPQVRLGAFSYFVSGFISMSTIGRYCSIGEDVQIGRQSHALEGLSTSPIGSSALALSAIFSENGPFAPLRSLGQVWLEGPDPETISIGHDVYIGHGAMIKPGVTIGTGAVIGMGSVVTRDVPPYAIVAGNPAKTIRLRFDDNVVVEMLDSEWWRFGVWDVAEILASGPEIALERIKLMRHSAVLPYSPKWVSAAREGIK